MTRLSASEPRITAGDFLLYLRCPRALHVRLSSGALPESMEADRLYPIRSDRERLRELARSRYPGGVQAPPLDLTGAPNDRDVQPGATLFNARCYHEPFEAAADVWLPTRPEGMAAVLVREGTSVKESCIREAAFLDYCFEGCSAQPARIVLLHVDKSYERSGEPDAGALFVERDLTRRVRRVRAEVDAELERLRRELDADPTLERYRETMCSRPRSCPVCSADVPAVGYDHVRNLHRGGPLVNELLDDGITTISGIPAERLTHPRQQIQRRTVVDRGPHVDARSLAQFLGRLSYPIAYLDFEATSTAIPPFEHVRPWEHVPYLYSLHVETEDGSLSHRSFIMRPGFDERAAMAEHLAADTEGCESVVVYSAGFERGILARLSAVHPEHGQTLVGLAQRIVDLLEPFSEFAYHHYEQAGKVSLKAVLPVLTNENYADETIRDGYTANLAYRHLTERGLLTGEQSPDRPRNVSTEQLLAELTSYCAMDTMAMVHIVRALRALAAE